MYFNVQIKDNQQIVEYKIYHKEINVILHDNYLHLEPIIVLQHQIGMPITIQNILNYPVIFTVEASFKDKIDINGFKGEIVLIKDMLIA